MPRHGGLDYMLPFLDPQFDPNHPIHSLPPIQEDPYAPLSKRVRKQILEKQLNDALTAYVTPHVIRSWEVDKWREIRRNEILTMKLSWGDYGRDGLPSPIKISRDAFLARYNLKDSSATRRTSSPYDSHRDPEHDDFRQFAVANLHLGYHRFHPSTVHDPETDELLDSVDIAEPEICWIMEYTEHESMIIRRQLARLIGIYPAAVDQETDAYDEEIAFRYDKRLKVRCRRRTKRCIRPSHLEIFASNGQVLP